MRTTRHALVIFLIAMALCADRAAAASVTHRPVVGDWARQLAVKLAVSIRRTVPTRAIALSAAGLVRRCMARLVLRPASAVFAGWRLSPFEFRLPPPATV